MNRSHLVPIERLIEWQGGEEPHLSHSISKRKQSVDGEGFHSPLFFRRREEGLRVTGKTETSNFKTI